MAQGQETTTFHLNKRGHSGRPTVEVALAGPTRWPLSCPHTPEISRAMLSSPKKVGLKEYPAGTRPPLRDSTAPPPGLPAVPAPTGNE